MDWRCYSILITMETVKLITVVLLAINIQYDMVPIKIGCENRKYFQRCTVNMTLEFAPQVIPPNVISPNDPLNCVLYLAQCHPVCTNVY